MAQQPDPTILSAAITATLTSSSPRRSGPYPSSMASSAARARKDFATTRMACRPRYRGNLIFCDWGLQTVHRWVIEPSGATFRVVSKEPLVEKGDLTDFRPFSIAVGARRSFILPDRLGLQWLALERTQDRPALSPDLHRPRSRQAGGPAGELDFKVWISRRGRPGSNRSAG